MISLKFSDTYILVEDTDNMFVCMHIILFWCANYESKNY